MPDELPPPEPLPEGNISPEFLGQLEHSARWAGTFNEATTNLAQRQRYNQDITAYGEALAQQRAQHQYEALQKDKAAQNLYFKTQQLDLQKKEAEARMQHANELFPLKKQAQESQVAADLAREKALVQAAALKSTAAQQEHADTDAFHATINNGLAQGIKIGTPEYADLVTRARLDAPAMKSEIFDDLWKSTSRSKLTPEEAIDQAREITRAREGAKAEFRQADGGFVGTAEEARARYGPDALLHETAKGKWTATIPADAQSEANRAGGIAAAREKVKAQFREADRSFYGTADEARDFFGPSAKMRLTPKGGWVADLPAEDEAARAADKTRAVLEVKKDFAPKQQEIIDTFVAKRAALEQFKPTNDQKIQYQVDLKKALQGLNPTEAEKISFAVAKATAVDAAKTAQAITRAKEIAKAKGISDSVANAYSEGLSELSGLDQQARDAVNQADKNLIAAKRIKHEEFIRSMEALHPSLRASRGLDENGKPVPQAVLAPESEGRIGPPSPDRETPEQIRDRIKAAGGTKEDFAKALRDAGHNL